VKVVGLHCHIGSQIFELAPFEEAARVMLTFIAKIKEELGIEIEELNLGGGFGIKYTQDDDPIEYDRYIKSVSEVVKSVCEDKGIKLPFIVIEPGRSIVASAGITLYRIGTIKDIKGVRKYIAVDGGMTDNPRYALYQSNMKVLLPIKLMRQKQKRLQLRASAVNPGTCLARTYCFPKRRKGYFGNTCYRCIQLFHVQ